MSEVLPGMSAEIAKWSLTQELFGADGIVMDIYRDYGYFVAEPFVCEGETGDDTKILPFSLPKPEVQDSTVKFLLASLNPETPRPDHLESRPHIICRIPRTDAAFGITLQPEQGIVRRITQVDLYPERTVLRHRLETNSQLHVSGTRDKGYTLEPLSPTDIVHAMEGAIENLKMLQGHIEDTYGDTHNDDEPLLHIPYKKN